MVPIVQFATAQHKGMPNVPLGKKDMQMAPQLKDLIKKSIYKYKQ